MRSSQLRMRLSLSVILFMSLFAEPAMAGFFDEFINPSQDKSVEFLGMIFGSVGNTLNGSGGPLFGQLFQIFNVIIFSLGSIVLSYTTIVSMVNTAQEGEVMGRKWSSLWLPLRSAASIGALLPLSSGYSLIQVLMMWIVLQGIGAANELWYTILSLSEKGYSINLSPSKPPFAQDPALAAQIDPIIKLVFASTLCKNFINNTQQLSPGQEVMIYTESSCNGSGSPCVLVGVPNSMYLSLRNVCGQFTFPNLPNNVDQGLVQQGLSALNTALYTADQATGNAISYALSTLSNPSERALSSPQQILNSVLAQQTAFAQVVANNIPAPLYPQVMENYYLSIPVTFSDGGHATSIAIAAQQNGWLFMGSYYYLLSASLGDTLSTTGPSGGGFVGSLTNMWHDRTSLSAVDNISTFPSPNMSASSADNMPPSNTATMVASSISGVLYTTLNDYQNAVAALPKEATPSQAQIPSVTISLSFNNGIIDSILKPVTDFFSKIATNFMNYLTTNAPDPLMSLRTVGCNIMATVENGMILTIGAVMTASLLGSILDGFQPLGSAIAAFVTFFMPILTALAALLWGAGALLGIYLPLIPYLLFLFGGIAWLIGVVESMIAAPMVALGIAVPSQNEHLGSAGPAVMLITNIFLRPALMVIGFVTASKLYVIAIQMLNLTFGSVLNAQGITTNLGLFSAIALVVTYAGVVITITHRSFSLIHHVPDKVLRWIGGHEQMGEASRGDVEKTEQSFDKASSASGKASDAAYGLVASRAETVRDNLQKKMAERKAANKAAGDAPAQEGGGGGGEGGGGEGGGGGGAAPADNGGGDGGSNPAPSPSPAPRNRGAAQQPTRPSPPNNPPTPSSDSEP